MDITIHGKNTGVSDRLEEYAEKKLSRLEKYLPNIIEANLELRKEKRKAKDQPIAQLTVRNNRGVVLRAEDKKQTDMFFTCFAVRPADQHTVLYVENHVLPSSALNGSSCITSMKLLT